MSITTADVHIKKSEVMSDVDSGGGHMTGVEVVDGDLNNVFDDTSRTDRVNGRVSVRKVFGCALTSTVDKFLGAHAIITRPPADGRVSALILDLNSHSDHRTDAQAFVEQYLVASIESLLTLYSDQPGGARQIITYANVGTTPPAVGDVICLSVELSTNALYGTQQFLRVTSVDSVDITAYDSQGPFTKTQFTIGVSAQLDVTFPGTDIARQPTLVSKPTRLRKTDLNSAARYYGIAPLAANITAGDLSVKVSSILQPVVPASYAETALLDRQVGASVIELAPSGPSLTTTRTFSVSGGVGTLTLPRSSVPGSVSVSLGAGTNAATFVEGGGGVLTRTGGGSGTVSAAGTVTSNGGAIAFTGLVDNGSTSISITWTPAAAVNDVQNTVGILITLVNRGFNFSQSLSPKPAPGSVIVTFRALNHWYTLTDDGNGLLVGATGSGAGTVNYTTGTVNVTCGYQPDVGSQVLFGWGTAVHYKDIHADSSLLIGAIDVNSTQAIKPGTLTLSYTVSGTGYSVTDNGVGGLTGDLVSGTGLVDYVGKRICFVPLHVPAQLATLTAAYTALAGSTYTPSPEPAASGGSVTFTIPGAPLQAGAVRIRAQFNDTTYNPSDIRTVAITDDGSGVLKATTDYGTVTMGSVAYSTGVVTFNDHVLFGRYVYSSGSWSAVSYTSYAYFTVVDVSSQPAGSGAAQSDSITLGNLTVDFSRALIDGTVGGSVLFDFNGNTYRDVAGSLFTGLVSAPVLSGSIDLGSGLGTITTWTAGASAVTSRALLTAYGQWQLGAAIWRTDGAPIRSGSFSVTDGTHTATADSTGTLIGGGGVITGSINIDTGVYSVAISPAVDPSLLRYNAVAITYLPIDPAILGLDSVRLPLDGQVPIFGPGYDLVILNDQTDTLTNPVVAGTTYTLSRSSLNSVQLYDANGLKVTTDKYTADLLAGTVTMANPLDLSAYVQPLKVEHRIEDMVLCVDAQLSGDLQISGYISHSFPTTGTYVASAKLYGDLQAYVDTMFSQGAWTSVWQNTVIGSPPTAQYNAVGYPFVLHNDGAITERWRIEFTNSNSFRLVGETLGVVATGSTLADFAPTNPATGQPWFTIAAAGWGSGWVAGNQLRFNTHANAAPIWLLRCTQQGPATDPTDQFRLQFRGDN